MPDLRQLAEGSSEMMAFCDRAAKFIAVDRGNQFWMKFQRKILKVWLGVLLYVLCLGLKCFKFLSTGELEHLLQSVLACGVFESTNELVQKAQQLLLDCDGSEAVGALVSVLKKPVAWSKHVLSCQVGATQLSDLDWLC